MLGWLRRRARAEGVLDGRGGAVAFIQRFGAALNVNPHTHALVLDGVFAEASARTSEIAAAPGSAATATTPDEPSLSCPRIDRR